VTQGALPTGLTLNPNTGAISGRPGAAGTSNFTAKAVDKAGNSGTVACGIDDVAITMDRLEVTQPATPNAVTDATPAVTPVSSTNTSAAFAAADSPDLVSVLKAGTITVKGINIQPAGSDNNVQWLLERDPNDRVNLTKATGCDGNPAGAPAVHGSPGAQVSFDPEAGNFHLVAFIDANGNGRFDEGEQLRILRIAVVRATLLNPDTSTFNIASRFVANTPEPGKERVLVEGPGGGPAMKIIGDYMIEGGGTTCRIGARAITVGNVGNLYSDTFVLNYPGTPPGTSLAVPAGVPG
jgi:hypothetical protein